MQYNLSFQNMCTSQYYVTGRCWGIYRSDYIIRFIKQRLTVFDLLKISATSYTWYTLLRRLVKSFSRHWKEVCLDFCLEEGLAFYITKHFFYNRERKQKQKYSHLCRSSSSYFN